MSNASSRSIEAVAKANGDGHLWYQLAWQRDLTRPSSPWTPSPSAGIRTTSRLPTSPSEPASACKSERRTPSSCSTWASQCGQTTAPAFPLDLDAFRKRFVAGDEEAKVAAKVIIEWLSETASGRFQAWEDLAFFRENCDGPIVLKGVQTPEDAHAAMDARMDGIVVSNHGGRQIDGGISSFSALEKITASSRVLGAHKEGKFTVLFDSGIRKGSDVIKAIAMGAQDVLVGRPFMYGLTIGGEYSVEEVLRLLLADTEVTLGLSGYKSIEEIWAKREAVLEKVYTSTKL
ncbi:FMN-dependent dehydrogenase [Lactarius quietus]|nr:FMN-dependent dehydrogenase [Lactarius quietus]